MATTTTALIPPPLRDKIADTVGKLARPLQNWLFSLQNRDQLKEVDTTAGNYAETTPPAGLNASTGQSNQNQRITYKKVSADGNTYTLNPSATGPLPEGAQTLTAQWSKFTIQSNGTRWLLVA